jgi:hypothetical protein
VNEKAKVISHQYWSAHGWERRARVMRKHYNEIIRHHHVYDLVIRSWMRWCTKMLRLSRQQRIPRHLRHQVKVFRRLQRGEY